jgi:dTDP-4-amino-4,6-dideoxygalactose transaminase
MMAVRRRSPTVRPVATRPLITVTRPDLPPLQDYVALLEQVWSSRVISNCGPLHERLEHELREHLGVEQVSLFNNATVALMVALRHLGVEGEVITTPFSFVATAHSLVWTQLEPVFVDIDPRTFNLDPSRIEAAITPRTRAILPVHCYGYPCDVEAIERVARKHGLRVIYDAAHAFGVRDGDRSILRSGDLSVVSFHATKVFNTAEGGIIVSPDAATKQRIDNLRNFGIIDEVTVTDVGLNGKMSELHAALGLLQLERVERSIARRLEIDATYRSALADVPGLRMAPVGSAQLRRNGSYFPILVEPAYGESRDALYERLREHGVLARRYFYPLISRLPAYAHLPSAQPGRLPAAEAAAAQVLCLPIYADLTDAQQSLVIELLVRR